MKIRFLVGIALILAIAVYMAFMGFNESKSYYHTCDEVAELGESAYDHQLRIAGNVVEGSIRPDGDILTFDIEYEGVRYPVRYVGMDPVPDSFKDGVEAVVEGRLTRADVFEGSRIQAKCASKYESESPEANPESHPEEISIPSV